MCLQPHSFLNELSDLYNSPPLNSSNSLGLDFNLWKIVSSLNKRHITVYHGSKHRFWECHKYFGLDNFLVSESVFDSTGLLRNRFWKKMKLNSMDLNFKLFCDRLFYENCWMGFEQVYENFEKSKIFNKNSVFLVRFLTKIPGSDSDLWKNFFDYFAMKTSKLLRVCTKTISIPAKFIVSSKNHQTLDPTDLIHTNWKRVKKIQAGLCRACKSWHFLTHDLRFWFRRSEKKDRRNFSHYTETVCDQWSIGMLFGEVVTIYDKLFVFWFMGHVKMKTKS